MEIDYAIATKLFGIKRTCYPDYSTSYEHVGLVLEALRKRGFVVSIDSDTADGRPHFLVMVYGFAHTKGDAFWIGEEETLPLALCKAALLALEGK